MGLGESQETARVITTRDPIATALPGHTPVELGHKPRGPIVGHYPHTPVGEEHRRDLLLCRDSERQPLRKRCPGIAHPRPGFISGVEGRDAVLRAHELPDLFWIKTRPSNRGHDLPEATAVREHAVVVDDLLEPEALALEVRHPRRGVEDVPELSIPCHAGYQNAVIHKGDGRS